MAPKNTPRKNGWLWPAAAVAGTMFLCVCMLIGLVSTGVLNPGYILVSAEAVSPTNAPVEPTIPVPAPTEEPAPAAVAPANLEVWLIGGRTDSNGKTHEVITAANGEIFVNGTPMQMWWSQVGNSNLADFEETYEVCNDGGCSQYFIIQEDGKWVAYTINREDSGVSFWEVSWMQYNPSDHYLTICVDDAGAPGDMADVDGDGKPDKWVGSCAGEKMRIESRMSLDDLMASSAFAPWADELKKAMQSYDWDLDNNLMEVVAIFRQAK